LKAPSLHVGQKVADVHVRHARGHITHVGWKKNIPVKNIYSYFRKAPTGHEFILTHRELDKNLLSLQSKQLVFKGPLQVRHSL
jgi:hypothetical protein